MAKGTTLIETIVFVVLLSFLMAGIIQYSVDMNYQNIELAHEIEDAQK